MFLDLGMVVGGLVALLLAGDLLVRGAVNLALRLGIPAMLVGMTVVAFGTSAPELLVSVRAAVGDAGGLALGNVVGSNVANILLVLGAPALISAMAVDRKIVRDYIIMIAATFLFIGLAFTGTIGTWQALVLLAFFAAFMVDSIRRGLHARVEPEELEGADPGIGWTKIVIFLILGVVGLPLGANLLVTGATSVARDLGVSDALIGLTLVAIGTSLPELAATVMAAIRREGGVALGNIVGSNLFNLVFIIGTAGLFGTMTFPPEMFRLDLWVMLGSSLILAPFIWKSAPITRVWGAALLLGYAGYMWILIQTGA
jgi:cation:H+ antiporter